MVNFFFIKALNEKPLDEDSENKKINKKNTQKVFGTKLKHFSPWANQRLK